MRRDVSRRCGVTREDTLSLIAAPAKAVRGDSSSIEVTTSGGGCAVEDSTVATLSATIVPYKQFVAPVENASGTLQTFERQIIVR